LLLLANIVYFSRLPNPAKGQDSQVHTPRKEAVLVFRCFLRRETTTNWIHGLIVSMAIELTLRTYAPEDFETLYEIDQACYEPAIAYSKREFRNYLRFPGAECVIAEESGEVAGFCLTAHQRVLGYIVTIDVLGACRRRGVGTALLAEVESRLAGHGVKQIRLETATDNESAVAFWQRHGYRTRGVWKGYYPGGRDAYTMTKVISPTAAASKARH
jgi:ribosomal-protein-alanine N-acetyltransferase